MAVSEFSLRSVVHPIAVVPGAEPTGRIRMWTASAQGLRDGRDQREDGLCASRNLYAKLKVLLRPRLARACPGAGGPVWLGAEGATVSPAGLNSRGGTKACKDIRIR